MVDSSTTGVKRSAVLARSPLAETISILGTRMTYLALPWFVLVTTGSPGKMTLVLAAEILPWRSSGFRAGRSCSASAARTTMLVSDFARAPLLAAVPLLHATGLLSFGAAARARRVLGCFMAPYFAAQRTTLPGRRRGRNARVTGNTSIEGGRLRRAHRARARRAHLFIGAPNVLYVDAATYLVAFVLFSRSSRGGSRSAAVQHGVLAGLRFVLRTGCLRRSPRRSSRSDSSRRYVRGASRVRLRRVRRKLMDRRPLLWRARRRCPGRKPLRGVRGASPAAAAGSARRSSRSRSRCGCCRSCLRGRSSSPLSSRRLLHAARQRADSRRADPRTPATSARR